MIKGEDRIVACPHCDTLAKYITLVSGNTFGAVRWSDGKMIAPMLPRPPALVRCRNCAELYWLADARQVGSIHPMDEKGLQANPDWAAAQEVEEPSEEEYYLAIQKNLATNSGQEEYLRIMAWWRSNDAFRSAEEDQVSQNQSHSAQAAENLRALLQMLNGADENTLFMQAEILRELGEFEAAREILSRIKRTKENALILHYMISLCKKGDSRVKWIG